AMGGRAAEEVIFGHQTTGAGDDINKATDIARKMVCSWGMSEKLGPLSFGKQGEEVFLGREMGTSRNYSEKVAQLIDDEVQRIVMAGYTKAVELLKEHRKVLEQLAEALLLKETIETSDIDRI